MRWIRRAVTVPAVMGMALVSILTAPLWIPLLAVIDLLGRGRSAALRCGAFACAYLQCETAGILASFGLWIASGACIGLGRRRFIAWNYALQRWWAGTLWSCAVGTFGLRLSVEGQDDLGTGPLLLLPRHASLGDTLLPSVLVTARTGLRLRYVLKRELLVDPCLDIVGHRLPNVFVRRGAEDGEAEIRRVADLAEGLGPGEGVLIYPEGTRFSRAKRERVLRRLAEGGDPALLERAKRLEHVLPPRLGGTLALLERAPQADVVFCAHVGFEGAATAGRLWRGALVGREVRVRFFRVSADAIPRDPEARTAWLLNQWSRVDAWVGENLAVAFPEA